MKIAVWMWALLACLPLFAKDLSDIDLEKNSKAGYLHLPRERAIDQSSHLYIKYALETFEKENVSFVLLDLDTPGGEVFAALRISEMLKAFDQKTGIPVIAFVDRWALSAGALLAYSCRYIGAVSDASMGAAEPVLVSSEGEMKTASEKMVSALRTEFATAASFYHRDPWIAEAMVDKDLLLVERKGKVLQLLSSEQIVTKGSHPDIVITTPGKLLTLNASQMKHWKIADFVVPSRFLEAPFLQGQVPEWIEYHNWKINVFSFLSQPIVSSFLMMGLMIGLYGMVQGGGIGGSAILGLGCLSLILLSSFATEMIHFLELFLIFLGLALLLSDVFFLAGFGFLGVLGLFVFLAGLVALMLPPLEGFSWSPKNWGIQMDEWTYRLSLFLSSILLFFTVIAPFLGWRFRKSSLFKKVVLQETKEETSLQELLPSIGKTGIAFSSLRPFGKVQIDDIVYEAQTEGEFLQPSSQVEVIGFRGKFLLVQEKR